MKFHAKDPQILGATIQNLQLHAQLDLATTFPFTYYHEQEIQSFMKSHVS